jgi:CRP/FNR family cyclic AMP-dependent transcriptional regulator
MTPAERLVALNASAWFTRLPAELAEWIATNARSVTLGAGQRLFSCGDAPDGVYVVVDGAIRIATSTADGKEALLVLIEPAQWFGEMPLFDDSPRPQDAWADNDCRLLHLPQAVLVDFLDRHPQHWKSFGLLLAQKLRLALRLIEANALLPPPRRLAQRLIAMAYGYGDWHGAHRRVLDVQQDDLGSMLSMSRQSVNQLLKDLESQGFLRTGRGSIEILDMPRFKVLALA